MKKITMKEFEAVKEDTTRCILIVQCTRTRACAWEGLENHYDEKRVNEYERVNVCPRCGNDQFYMKYEPVYSFESKYVEKV